LEIADEIAAKSPMATRLAKQALNLIEHMPLDDGYQVEQLHTLILSGSEDSKEAAAAFLEKRSARFSS
jgi:enoyl-CoA hydratase/carnithine racemase